MLAKRILSLGVAVLASSCVTPAPLNLAAVGGEQRLVDRDAVSIAISEADRNRIDSWVVFGKTAKQSISTGPIWSRGFVGGPDAPKLSIRSAVLVGAIEGGGFAIRYTYNVEATLVLNGVDFPIHASANRATAMNNQSAMRQAVELSVKDTAQKAQAIVNANQGPLLTR